MLKHVIIKKKPVVHISQVNNHYPITVKKRRDNFTLQELNDIINSFEFSAGDYITYKSIRAMSDLHSVFYCKEIITNIDKIPSWSPSDYPEICLIIPAHADYPGTKREWHYVSGWAMTKLDNNQYTKLIDDNVQNRIKDDIAAWDKSVTD